MAKSLSEDKWKKYGLNSIKEVAELSFRELIIELGDLESGIIAAMGDVCRGNKSRTPSAPISVTWIREEDRFLVTDGLHRLAESILFNKEKISFICEIDWSGYSLKWSIPEKENRLL